MSGSTETVVQEREIEMVVRAARTESENVRSIELVPADDAAVLPPWTPGAHIDIVLDVDGAPLTRQYSLCGDTAADDSWTIAVLRAPDSRGGSTFVHDNLSEGDRVLVRGPRNHFALARSASYLFIAGGIGVTPILPMIEEAEAAGAQWRLVYGGRNRASMAFLGRLAAYGDRVEIVPEDELGTIDLGALLGEPSAKTLVYCCGPAGLLDAVEQRCASWPKGALQLERFSAVDVDDSDNGSFDVVLQRTGLTVTVPADKSIYEVVRENDVSVLASCLEGICGTCETAVLDGEVEHRDAILDDEERASNTTMMICVSRCRGARLTLDL